jgi:raffinose/stachyose/melibiose transport system substrate-binding protein
MQRLSRRGFLTSSALGAVGVIGLSACTPGMSGGDAPKIDPSAPVSTDIAGAGKVTLTVWDQNTDGGIDTAQKRLNAQFHQRYPNVTIDRVTRSFADLKTTLKLALSSDDPPDVVQANQGYPDMGAFVQGGLLQPVDRYARTYGWNRRFPRQLLDLNTFSTDGADWQTGSLYGISSTGEIVGVYYNKSILAKADITPPRTFAQFQTALAKLKAAGQLPLQYGDSDKSPGIHLFGTVQANIASKTAIRNLVQSKAGKWTDASTVDAAQIVIDWAKKGYLTPGANGVSADLAVENFGKGKGGFLIDGTWQQATVTDALKGDAGFVALSAKAGATPVAQGGEGLAWAITSRSRNPDVAAAYLNFITGAHASDVLVATGNLPAILPAGYKPKPNTLGGAIAQQWQVISQRDGLVPYLDYTTPTFYDTMTSAVQELTAGQLSAQKFGEVLQTDYHTFERSR